MGLFGIGAKGITSPAIKTGNMNTQAVDILKSTPVAVAAATQQNKLNVSPQAAVAPVSSPSDNANTSPIAQAVSSIVLPIKTKTENPLFEQLQRRVEERQQLFEKAIEIQEKKLIEDLVRTDANPNVANLARQALADSPISRIVQEKEIAFAKKTYTTPRLTDQIFDDPSSIVNRPNVISKILSPKKILEKMNQYKQPPSPDTLKNQDIKFINGALDVIPRNGISALRPEILGLINYTKIFDDNQFTEHGLVLNFSQQSRILRKVTLFNIINLLISNDRTKDAVRNLMQNQDSFFADISNILDIFYGNLENINKIKGAFELSTLENKSFIFLPLKEFFKKRMQYNEESYLAFSDTKILLQLMFDLRSVLENYSLNLLNSTDFDRINDLNPISLDNTYTLTNNFNFTIKSIQSNTNIAKKATLPIEFINFINSLPANSDDRIKLLLHLLSKELRVSKSLSKNDVRRKITEYYKGDPDGNPFDNVVGQIGSDIFDKVLGENSLVALFQTPLSNGMILPFESKTVDDGQTTYLPGSTFFADTILSLVNGNSFNIKPLQDYSETFTTTLANAKYILEETYEKFSKSSLAPWPLFWKFLQFVLGGTENTGINNPMTEQLAIIALFKLAHKNTTLKTMLFQFYVLMSIALTTDTNRSKIVDKLINDLGDIRSLTYVKVDPNNLPELLFGMAELSPNLEQLADDIETEVVNILFGTTFADKIKTILSKQTKNKTVSTSDKTPKRIQNDPQFNKITLETDIFSPDSTTPNSILEKGFIKRILLSTRNTDGNSIPTLFNQLIQFHVFFDSQASIQGNELSYFFDNNSTRFNFISASYLILFNFELFSSFIAKFFNAEFTKSNSNTSTAKVALSYNAQINQETILYINSVLADTPEPYRPIAELAQSSPRVIGNLSTGNMSRILNVNPNMLSPTIASNNSAKSKVAGLVKRLTTGQGQEDENNGGQFINAAFAAGSSLITSFILQNQVNVQRDVGLASNPRNTGGANTFTPSFFGSSQQINTNLLGRELQNIITPANRNNQITGNISSDALMFRITNNIYVSLTEIKKKISEEDVYIQNVIDILEIIGNRLSVNTSYVSAYFRQLEQSSNFSNYIKYNSNSDFGHLKASSAIFNRMKNSDLSSVQFMLTPEQRNQTFQAENNKYLSLLSLLKTDLFKTPLANSRVKILPIGLPVGFSSKLIDRITKNEINKTTFKDSESDVVYVTVYKKSAEDQDIIFSPQRFMFDLSLFDLDTNSLSVNNNTDIVKVMNSISVLDFTENKQPEKKNLEKLKQNIKYSFLSPDQINEIFFNQVVSELLKYYTYNITGLNFSEEVFLEKNYIPEIYNGFSNIPEETKILLTEFYKIKTGDTNATFSTIVSVLQNDDSNVPESVKDDMRILIQGPALLRENFIRTSVLETKKFEKILMIPINIDSFVVDQNMTRETTAGKRSMEKQSFNDKIKIEKISLDDELIYLNRSDKSNVLVFEDYFVTIRTVKSA